MVKPTPGFKIDPEEMERLSRTFRLVSAEYQDTLPKVIAIPRGGGSGIDRAMATTLKTINEMHTLLYEAIGKHGGKLEAAAFNYLQAEKDSAGTVKDVQRLVAMGNPLLLSEKALVAEYLAGRSPNATPAPTQTPSIYGGIEGLDYHHNPTLAKVSSAVEIAPRKQWVYFQHQIIDFDYRGLCSLVDELNGFVKKADSLAIQLIKSVAEFCSPYRNYGEAVFQFNATFSEDASLASGFHKVVSTISAAIDSFANEMAEKEAWLEEYAHKCGMPDSLLSQLTEGQNKEQIRQYFQDAIGSSNPNRSFGLFVQACVTVLRQAEELRKQTAGQLIILAETIASGGLDYYTKKDTHPGSADPSGLFDDGNSQDREIARQLESELADDGKRLRDSRADVKSAFDGISKIGGYGGQIGGLIGGIEGVRKSNNLIETTKNVGSLAGAVGPVLETLGLLVFAE